MNRNTSPESMKIRFGIMSILFVVAVVYYLTSFGISFSFTVELERTLLAIIVGIFIALIHSAIFLRKLL